MPSLLSLVVERCIIEMRSWRIVIWSSRVVQPRVTLLTRMTISIAAGAVNVSGSVIIVVFVAVAVVGVSLIIFQLADSI